MLRTASDPAEVVSAPSIGADVAAWELGQVGARDIVVDRFNAGEEYVLRADAAVPMPGDQHGPAAMGTLVAFIDEADGASVQLHESTPRLRGTQLLCAGRATGVALGEYKSHTIAAIARAADGHDEDIEVRDLTGELAALRVSGEQRNPHVSADWVAFEDLSTGHSQVVLWQWTTGLVFVPHPSQSQQQLNDVYAGEGRVRVVFADDAAGNLDIALFDLTVSPTIPDDGQPTNWPPPPPPPDPGPVPATCDLGSGKVIATLSLGRDGQKPEAGEIEFRADGAVPGTSLPVRICIHAVGVSAAWVALDDEAVARPCAFKLDEVNLEVLSAVDDGEGEISAVLAGRPGATLDVWVITDPDRAPAPDCAGQSGPALLTDGASSAAGAGCASGMAGGLGCLAALAFLFLRRRS